MSSAELKKVLHDLCRAVEPYYIAYQLAQARRGRDSTNGAGENPQPSTHFENRPDSPFGFGRVAGSLKAQRSSPKFIKCELCGKQFWSATAKLCPSCRNAEAYAKRLEKAKP